MSFENRTPKPEKEPRFPGLDEIKAKIEKLCGQENPKVLRTLEDEKGVYLHEAVTTDEKGDASLFSYRRVGEFRETKTAQTHIDVAFFDGPIEDGVCVGGDILSQYDEGTGEWHDLS